MLSRKSILVVLLVLICLSFFGTLYLSARMLPENYDWRYRVISNLLSPRDNPNHHWLSACGIALTALLMLPFAGYLQRNLEGASPRVARVSGAAFVAGVIALVCTCLVVPQHVHAPFGIRRLHEFLARSSAGCLAIGMLCGCWCAWKGRRQSGAIRIARYRVHMPSRLGKAQRAGAGFPAGLFLAWSLVTVLPLTGLFVSECLLLLTRWKPLWAAPIRNLLRHSVLWHLGFWEWTGAAAVFVFLCASVFLPSPQTHSER